MVSAVVAAFGVAACGPGASPSPTLLPSAQPSTLATSSPPPTPRPTTALRASPTPSPSPSETIYVVKKGDTLWAIAKKFNVTLAALQEANPEITDPTKLRVGTQLRIPSP